MPRALAQLKEILAYIERDSLDVADKVKAEFESAFELLARHPGLGRSRDDLARQSVKFWTVHPFLVAYDPAASPLEIVAVFRSARHAREWFG